jgi:hypothetical protein
MNLQENLNRIKELMGVINVISEAEEDQVVNKEFEISNNYDDDVVKLQKILIDKNYDIGSYGPEKNGVDGKYGDLTKKAHESLISGITPDKFNKNSKIDNVDNNIEDNKSTVDLSQINDVSSSSTYKRKNEKIGAKYFIIHHTAGGKKQEDIVNILNNRGLGIQWVIDREGKIFQTLPLKGRGAHIKAIGRQAPKDVSNSTAEGVEIIANDDDDVLEVQCKAALILVKKLGYSYGQIYGHGEVSKNKQPTEGQKCKTYIKNNL